MNQTLAQLKDQNALLDFLKLKSWNNENKGKKNGNNVKKKEVRN